VIRGSRAIAGALILLVGCAAPDEPARRPPAPPSPDVVARIGDVPITAAELDESIRLPLHDLDRARFDLRAARLRDVLVGRVVGPLAAADGVSIAEWVRRHGGDAAVEEALAQAHVEVLLGAPEAPVLAVSADDDAVRGAADAPVTIVEYVDYQSPYCARMQPVMARLLAELPTQVRLVVRDLPLSMHRDAELAAEAAECAGAQGAYWPYHDVLLQEQDALARSALDRHAARVGLDVPAFARCLDGREMRAEVAADAADAARLGVTVVPTMFVNGRYLRGPQTYEALRAVVDAELTRLGLTLAPPAVTSTTVAAAAPAPAPTSTTIAAALPTSTITLDAAAVRRALRRRGRLARDLEQPPGDPGPGWEGHALVRVRRVRRRSLFEQMGLRTGDVVMTVDGVVVIDDGTALFDALGSRSQVTVQVLRRGLPSTFEYVVR
jgi:protein-disulfide isomerase